MLRWLLGFVVSMVAMSIPRMVPAATFTPVWLKGPEPRALILIQGPIVPGDTSRLMATMNVIVHARPGAKTLAVDLNTPGGNVAEGEALATIIGLNGLDTVLYPGATCASACPMMFFAGSRKILGSGARLGVHRASIGPNGNESPSTMDTSIRIGRMLTRLGAPKRVIEKLLATPPGSITWLIAADLVGVQGLEAGPSPTGAPSDEFARGWDDGRRNAATSPCGADMSAYSDGCRAGADSAGGRR